MLLPAGFDLERLTHEQQAELLDLLEEEDRYQGRRLFYSMYPERDSTWTGPTNKDFLRGQKIYRRELYPKHLEFFDAGAKYRERCLMAANRVSKTLGGGAYETTCHLTGEYPEWWTGRRFVHPVQWWACGKTNETTRDIVQATLLGKPTWRGAEKMMTGTGTVPGDMIGDMSWKQGVANLVDTVLVKHFTNGREDGWSELGIKSYQQGRGAFEGTAKHGIWDDEEPPLDIYSEQLIRTATTNGIILITFTPKEGRSEVVKGFLPTSEKPDA